MFWEYIENFKRRRKSVPRCTTCREHTEDYFEHDTEEYNVYIRLCKKCMAAQLEEGGVLLTQARLNACLKNLKKVKDADE